MADDMFSKLSRGFSSIGARVREGAGDLKKAAGVGVGAIDLELDAAAFRPGDTIRGVVRLRLSEPTRAERLVVTLLGTNERVTYSKDAAGHKSQRRHTETVCELERELGGEATYHDQERRFELVVPPDARARGSADPSSIGGVLGDVARMVSAVAEARRLPVAWRVVATLYIPWRRNITRKCDLTILD